MRGGRWCQALLEGPPDAAQRALTFAKTRAEPRSPQEEDSALAPLSNKHQETSTLTRSRPDGEPAALRAEIRSAQAAAECARRGFKCIYGAALQEAATQFSDWRADSAEPRQATAEWA